MPEDKTKTYKVFVDYQTEETVNADKVTLEGMLLTFYIEEKKVAVFTNFLYYIVSDN